MNCSYVKTPMTISFNTIKEKGYSLSSSHFKVLDIPNKNTVELRSLIQKPIRGKDQEAINFLDKSEFIYLKTKAIKDNMFIADVFSAGCFEFLKPYAYHKSINKNNTLKEGDILYCSSGGEEIGDAAIILDMPNKIIYSSHSFKITAKDDTLKFYLLSFLKSKYCKEQLSFMVYRGATLRRGGDKFMALRIPMPNDNSENIIKFVEVLTQAIIGKEKLIKERHEAILKAIEAELLKNQKPNKFSFELPKINELEKVGRLDTNLYSENFKNIVFKIQNYKNGFQTIFDFGFTLSRGQNLQVSNIGESIYAKKKYSNFYTLMLPKFLSKYGTVDKIEYLGNPNDLKVLQKGDLIFGAEGFEKGRSIVIIEEQCRVITNIHGITIQQKEHNVNKAIYVKCCLDYLRNKGLVDLYAVGGNGGSLAQKYWEVIPFPIFPDAKQEEIALLYHNPKTEYKAETFTLANFLDKDSEYNQTAGIYELDKTAKQLKEILNNAIDNIINDKEVKIEFCSQS